jgi:hypothetical protein
MNIVNLVGKLYHMGSAEASALADGLETIWWDTKTEEEAKELALAYLKEMQGWAKKVEEVLSGARKEL